MLLGQTGKAIFLNVAARRFLKRSAHLSLQRDRLYAKNHGDTIQLEHLIKRVTGANGGRPIGGAVAVHRARGELPLQVIAGPLATDCRGQFVEGMGAVAMLMIDDPNAEKRLPQEIVTTLFDLTPTEATLLTALSEGRTLREYCNDHRVSYNTARTHLRAVFAKTGSSKQSDLVRLMGGLAHSLALPE